MNTNLQITESIAAFASEAELTWLAEQKAQSGKALALAFVKAPRFISKSEITSGAFQGWTNLFDTFNPKMVIISKDYNCNHLKLF